MNKTCYKCSRNLPEEMFHFKDKSTGKRHGYCRDCKTGYNSSWYERNKDKHIADVKKNDARYFERNKAIVLDHLRNNPCACGENELDVLDFHHDDPSQKDIEVSRAVSRYSERRLRKEIAKCSILCANCHRKLHARLRVDAAVAQKDRALAS